LATRLANYEEEYDTAPKGYQLNNGRLPHFCIPLGDRVYALAKWIKQNEDGTVSGVYEGQGPKDNEHIIDVYATPFCSPTSPEASHDPAEPLPPWYQYLLVGPGNDFQTLQKAVADLDDWGLAREICRYRELDNDITELTIKVECLQDDLESLRASKTACESRLQLAWAAICVEDLKVLHHKPGAHCSCHSAWRCKSHV
jgi:hypothetical protein